MNLTKWLQFWKWGATPKAPVKEPFRVVGSFPIFRFTCSECGAQKDQAIRRDSTMIKCICGGTAHRENDKLSEAEKPRWIDSEGNKVGVLARESTALVEHISAKFGAG